MKRSTNREVVTKVVGCPQCNSTMNWTARTFEQHLQCGECGSRTDFIDGRPPVVTVQVQCSLD